MTSRARAIVVLALLLAACRSAEELPRHGSAEASVAKVCYSDLDCYATSTVCDNQPRCGAAPPSDCAITAPLRVQCGSCCVERCSPSSCGPDQACSAEGCCEAAACRSDRDCATPGGRCLDGRCARRGACGPPPP